MFWFENFKSLLIFFDFYIELCVQLLSVNTIDLEE